MLAEQRSCYLSRGLTSLPQLFLNPLDRLCILLNQLQTQQENSLQRASGAFRILQFLTFILPLQ